MSLLKKIHSSNFFFKYTSISFKFNVIIGVLGFYLPSYFVLFIALFYSLFLSSSLTILFCFVLTPFFFFYSLLLLPSVFLYSFFLPCRTGWDFQCNVE